MPKNEASTRRFLLRRNDKSEFWRSLLYETPLKYKYWLSLFFISFLPTKALSARTTAGKAEVFLSPAEILLASLVAQFTPDLIRGAFVLLNYIVAGRRFDVVRRPTSIESELEKI
jgi:hypothetical protein